MLVLCHESLARIGIRRRTGRPGSSVGEVAGLISRLRARLVDLLGLLSEPPRWALVAIAIAFLATAIGLSLATVRLASAPGLPEAFQSTSPTATTTTKASPTQPAFGSFTPTATPTFAPTPTQSEPGRSATRSSMSSPTLAASSTPTALVPPTPMPFFTPPLNSQTQTPVGPTTAPTSVTAPVNVPPPVTTTPATVPTTTQTVAVPVTAKPKPKPARSVTVSPSASPEPIGANGARTPPEARTQPVISPAPTTPSHSQPTANSGSLAASASSQGPEWEPAVTALGALLTGVAALGALLMTVVRGRAAKKAKPPRTPDRRPSTDQ